MSTFMSRLGTLICISMQRSCKLTNTWQQRFWKQCESIRYYGHFCCKGLLLKSSSLFSMHFAMFTNITNFIWWNSKWIIDAISVLVFVQNSADLYKHIQMCWFIFMVINLRFTENCRSNDRLSYDIANLIRRVACTW